MTEFLWKDRQKFSSLTAEAGAADNVVSNFVLQSKSFWMCSCSMETLLPGSNNQAFVYGVVNLYVRFEMKGFKRIRN